MLLLPPAARSKLGQKIVQVTVVVRTHHTGHSLQSLVWRPMRQLAQRMAATLRAAQTVTRLASVGPDGGLIISTIVSIKPQITTLLEELFKPGLDLTS